MSYSQAADLMNRLLGGNYHAQHVYSEGIKKSELPALKEFFMAQAAQKSRFINVLTDDIVRLNQTPKSKSGIIEATSNAWSELMLFFKGNSEEAILAECKKAEQNLLREYNDVLKYTSIIDSTRTLLVTQRDELNETIKSAFVE
ncbi:DUF2383 domain-containing protein [Ulvibacterium marinum]|uniref:DUF2383 domain-containing protein n=1 Tax=Ulvibacterium marinum TaxID=2419782 RepID=A0A3B0CBN7_9FLAO|nr:DUF2383 domain-containing protein [Ulvibacterium marinum]RKN83492.1 DUF2383 domain-containing protein [Ulvibacterium marinum]